MKPRIMTMAAVMGLIIALSSGDLLAAGRGKGGGNGSRNAACANQQRANGGSAVNRPAGSQRRDGTFQTTGVTANGSTTRPGRGNGPQDGSRLNTVTPTEP